MCFYLEMLKNYSSNHKIISLKEFKEILDTFFKCDEIFEKWIAISKDI